MTSINFNPSGNVNLQLKVETPENLTTAQRKIVDAFLSGSSFCYYCLFLSDYDPSFSGLEIVSAIIDIPLGGECIHMDTIAPLEEDEDFYQDLEPIKEMDSFILLDKVEENFEKINIIDPIPVKLIPYINGKKATKDVMPRLLKIDNMTEIPLFICVEKLKSKSINESPAFITSNFTILDSKNQEHTVHYNIYIINGKEDLINSELTDSLNSFLIDIQKTERIIAYCFESDHDSESPTYNTNPEYLLVENDFPVKKCFNLMADVDTEEELLENKFSYLQFRLADNDMNDLSINNENYEFQTSQGGDEIEIVLDVIPYNE